MLLSLQIVKESGMAPPPLQISYHRETRSRVKRLIDRCLALLCEASGRSSSATVVNVDLCPPATSFRSASTYGTAVMEDEDLDSVSSNTFDLRFKPRQKLPL